MPKLACRSCGRQIYTVSPLESLFAEERRCPRCGANLDTERRDNERRGQTRRVESAGRPGTARWRGATRRGSPRAPPPRPELLTGSSRYSLDASGVPRLRVDRWLGGARPARLGLAGHGARGLDAVGRRTDGSRSPTTSWISPRPRPTRRSPERTSSCLPRRRWTAWGSWTASVARGAPPWRPAPP